MKLHARYKIMDESRRRIGIDFRLIKYPESDHIGARNLTHAPRLYETVDMLQKRCDSYFASCEGVIRDRWGNPLRDDDGTPVIGQVKPYTISGLARHIGMSTSALKLYSRGFRDDVGFDPENVQFSDVLIAARQRVEEYAENRLYDKDGSFGARFALDAGFGWHTTKERADIENMKTLTELKKKEFELKEKLLSAGEEDTDITINIVRGNKK